MVFVNEYINICLISIKLTIQTILDTVSEAPTSAVATFTETELVCTLTHASPTDLIFTITFTIDETAQTPIPNGNDLVAKMNRDAAHAGKVVSIYLLDNHPTRKIILLKHDKYW